MSKCCLNSITAGTSKLRTPRCKVAQKPGAKKVGQSKKGEGSQGKQAGSKKGMLGRLGEKYKKFRLKKSITDEIANLSMYQRKEDVERIKFLKFRLAILNENPLKACFVVSKIISIHTL